MLKKYLEEFHNLSPSALLFLSSNLCWSFAFGIIGVIFNLYLLEIGIIEQQIGTITSCAAFAGTLMSLIMSAVIPSAGYRNTVVTASFLSFFALNLILFTDSFYWILFFYILNGIGTALIGTTQSPM
ncbi:MAG: hypothetical protein PHQ23_10215, partial [Candidatus Wallbacteria bacterium]|nr:hypothetical protein [Candidatus Wallbacteria bacterium]